MDLEKDTVSDRLDIAQAAEYLGISQMALRKRIQRGQLKAEKVDGRVYVVLNSLDTVSKTGGGGDKQWDSDETGLDRAGTGLDMVVPVLLERLDRMHRENLELAGRVGFLQAKLQDAEARILELEASTETSVGMVNQPTSTQRPPKRPWWAFWRAS